MPTAHESITRVGAAFPEPSREGQSAIYAYRYFLGVPSPDPVEIYQVDLPTTVTGALQARIASATLGLPHALTSSIYYALPTSHTSPVVDELDAEEDDPISFEQLASYHARLFGGATRDEIEERDDQSAEMSFDDLARSARALGMDDREEGNPGASRRPSP